MGLVENNEVPIGQCEIICLLSAELVGNDDNMIFDLEGPLMNLLPAFAVTL